MENSQKRYKILRKNDYIENAYDLHQKTLMTVFQIGAAVIGTTLAIVFAGKFKDNAYSWIFTGFGCINAGITAYHIVKLTKLLQNKTILEFSGKSNATAFELDNDTETHSRK